jgi:predicted MPP superfamily phosphohydrolase
LWAQGQDRTLLEHRGGVPRLVLTHNPATIQELRSREAVDLLIAGHTHGGQINIPIITCALMRDACRVTRYGFAEMERGLVFVTSGTGMVGLPMRFNAAPRIDVINLSWRACD